MQKKLIALAVAGLVSGGAFAQTNVTVSGLVRMSLEQYKLSSVPAGFDASAENRVSDQSSMLVFSGREDLGGGMYAGFNIDTRFGGDLGGFAASGNTNIHLGGNWGRVAMGRQDLHYGSALESYKAYTLQNILGNGIFSQIAGNSIANATRTPNVIVYDSPNMSGFSARIAASTSFRATEGTGVRLAGANDPGKGSAQNVALNYANGPIKAGYSYWRATNEGGKGATPATADQRGDTLQFGYTFPMGVAVGLGWNKSKAETTLGDVSRTAWLLPISYTFGANQVAFTYARANNLSGSLAAGATDTGASAYTLAFGHSLSKRTNVGVAYTKLDNKRNATYDLFGIGANGGTSTAAFAGADVSQLSLNMNHSF
ncbi:MAG: porin [Betaproteobacteria bacterium]|nr:porin [Betaproteobacteria bacterium]